MDKKRTRAFRISKAESKLKRKTKQMYHTSWYVWEKSYADFEKEVLSGKKHTWMRSQNTPCSCYMCSGYYKYRRKTNVNSRDILKDDDI